MKKLILTILLALINTQTYAFGWFILGVMIGGSGENTNKNPTKMRESNKYLEVKGGDCANRLSQTVMLNSNLISGIKEPYFNTHGKNCTEVQTYDSVFHINANYKIVKKKLFRSKNK